MSPLVNIALLLWVPVTIYFFSKKKDCTAVLLSVIGGVLFLPSNPPISISLFGLITFDKDTSIAIGLLLGTLIYRKDSLNSFELSKYDIPIIIYCFISPILTSLTNNLGINISSVISIFFEWVVFFWVGRIFFNDISSLKNLCKAMFIGGIIYIPLCLYEVRMSPKINIMLYKYFAHSMLQHIRYGHYRPIVFMDHGLMVALWMSITFTISFWLWKGRRLKKIYNIPIALLSLSLLFTTYMTRSSGALSYAALGILSWYIYKSRKKTNFLFYILLSIPIYLFARIQNLLTVDTIIDFLANFYEYERMRSLWIRLYQEDLYHLKMLRYGKLLFGWDAYGRSVPIDPRTGEYMGFVDSLWLITYSRKGLFGLISLYSSLLLSPFFILRENLKHTNKDQIYPIVLSLILIIFALDTLQNGMKNDIYVMCAGALTSYYIYQKKEKNLKTT